MKLTHRKWLWGLGAVASAWAFYFWNRRDQSLHEPQATTLHHIDDNPAVQAVVPTGRLSDRYAVQRTTRHVHRGIDIAAPEGSPVLAPQAGTVVGTWPDCNRSGYGNTVLVDHGGVYTFYAHLAQIAVAAGDLVHAGDVIGLVGSTRCGIDRAYMAPHLHFEVHTSLVGSRQRPTINERYPDRVDPEPYLERLWHGEDVVRA